LFIDVLTSNPSASTFDLIRCVAKGYTQKERTYFFRYLLTSCPIDHNLSTIFLGCLT